MAKKDPFESFREATLGGANPLKDAISHDRTPIDNDPRVPVRNNTQVAGSVQPAETVSVQQKPSKNADRELVSFHIDKQLKRKLGFVKFDTGKSYGDLYCEAVEDLLKKYGQL